MIVQPDNVSRSYCSMLSENTPRSFAFGYFRSGYDHYSRSKMLHRWSYEHCSFPKIVFRLTQFKRSFYLFGDLVAFGGIC